jgi:hypothetical protein
MFLGGSESTQLGAGDAVGEPVCGGVGRLGTGLLAVPFALAEGLVRVLPAETATTNVWLLRRRESDLRRLTREVRRLLEQEFEASRDWFAGDVSGADRVVPLNRISPSPRRRHRA